jgi:ribonucleoside-diphosphate reductase alpha chain
MTYISIPQRRADNDSPPFKLKNKRHMQKGRKFLSELKLYSDYFKWKEDEARYETWEDAVDDIISGHAKKYHNKDISSYLYEAETTMKDRLVLASQRNLQYRHKEIMKHNARMYNCVGALFNKNDYFEKFFYVLLCGCGLDFSVRIQFIEELSNIQKRTKGTKTFVIPDSIEGWADSLGVLMSSYFVDNQSFPEYAGFEIKFDYSLIRKKGSFISGGFRAPGPEGLKQSLERTEKLIEDWLNKEGQVIRPILAYDIIMHASDAVLSGGVRRSACSILMDEDDEEMIGAKLGNWRSQNPQRARSNNAVGLIRNNFTYEKLQEIINLNQGDNDISFIFVHDEYEISNPCREITFRPVLEDGRTAIQGCNLTEINASLCTTRDEFLRACKAAAILGTLQAGYTVFPYLGKDTEDLIKREALLGVSITGWMAQPMLFNAELLQEGAQLIISTNEELSKILGINPAARTTTVKPSGNASVVLGTPSGIHAEHSKKYFRIMQLNKESDTAKYLQENMPFLLEESVWSATECDYVVFIPIECDEGTVFKSEVKGIKHLELIKLVQENWVNVGTNEKYCLKPWLRHSVSCTVIVNNQEDITRYIFENQDSFKAMSFLSDTGDKDYNQAPFTSVLDIDQIVKEYGDGVLLASGLIVDGLHYFQENLWEACDLVLNRGLPVTGTREQVLLKKYWLKRAKKFAKNYFGGDLKRLIYCLKDVHLFHKWLTIDRQFKDVDFSKILSKPTFKDASDFSGMACQSGSCEITRI